MAVFKSGLLISAASVLCLASCAYFDTLNAPSKKAPQKLVMQKGSYADLPQWNNDDAAQALPAFARSCGRIAKSPPNKNFGNNPDFGSNAQWQDACGNLPPAASNSAAARQYFENNFTPYLATNDGDAQGLFTGYFEASLKGSSVKTGDYRIPLLAKPDDLIMVNLGDFREELKGQRIAGRNIGGNLKPYQDRAAIEDGLLPGAQQKPLLYVDSAVNAFFLQIQGSGIVTLSDGAIRRVGYDGQNGYPYYAIGKELVKRGHLDKNNVSMQTIRAWLIANPVEGREIMRTNKSYVFFKFTDAAGQDGPKGGEGVALTPGRSLAVDHSLVPYGVPVYIMPETPGYNRLMVAQDTGGAISGAVRGDIFFGYGAAAEKSAGPMQAKGRYWFLLPKRIASPDKK